MLRQSAVSPSRLAACTCQLQVIREHLFSEENEVKNKNTRLI